MPDLPTELPSTTLSISLGDIPVMSDDECLVRLAEIVSEHDSEHLDEAAQLIGRLAVPIE
jgi:hypothetical protein